MDANTATKTSSLLRLAKPVVLLGVTGLVLAYGMMSREDDGLAPQAQVVSADEVIADAPAAEAQSAPRARFALEHAPPSRRTSIASDDPARRLAQLHAQVGASAGAAAKRDQLVADMEAQHLAEPVDAGWSAQSEDRIVAASTTDVMARAGFAPQNLATDCRSHTCRISAQFTSAIAAKAWAERLLTQMGGTIGQAKVAVLPQSNGGYEVRVYGGRKA
jgi:hypothetical protein